MNGIIYSQMPIRLRLSAASNPPMVPIDENTGSAPRFFRAQDISMSIGVFDNTGNAVDLSNLSQLNLILQPLQNSPVISAIVIILAAAITGTITAAGWEDGSQANAVALLTAAQTDVGLSAMPSQDYWLIVQGVTAGGAVLTYGAGTVTVYDSGTQTPPAVNYVDGNRQTNSSIISTIVPRSQIHTEILIVGGTTPRTASIVLGAAGMQLGSRMWVELPSPVAGVTLNFYSGIISGPLVATYVTTGATDKFVFYHDGVQWQIEA
jgi:hypothetical protein